MHETDFDRLVGRFYESVLDPALWQPALHELTQQLDADAYHLLGWDNLAQMPMLELLSHQTIGNALPLHHGQGNQSAFNAAAARLAGTGETGLSGIVIARFAHHQQVDLSLALLRDPEKGAFTPRHAALLTRLIPHLHRAMRLLTPTRPVWRDDLSKAGEDASAFGVLAIDGARRLLHCNRSGEALLAAGEVLHRVHGLLVCTDEAQNQRFNAALDDVAHTGQPANLLLTARADARYSITLTPLLQEDGAPQHAPGVLCLVVALDQRRIATAHQLMQLFGLSAAEARLTRALAAGDTLEGYAVENILKMSTVKSQLHSVFEKTRAGRQSALVRLIAGIPPVRETRPSQN